MSALTQIMVKPLQSPSTAAVADHSGAALTTHALQPVHDVHLYTALAILIVRAVDRQSTGVFATNGRRSMDIGTGDHHVHSDVRGRITINIHIYTVIVYFQRALRTLIVEYRPQFCHRESMISAVTTIGVTPIEIYRCVCTCDPFIDSVGFNRAITDQMLSAIASEILNILFKTVD